MQDIDSATRKVFDLLDSDRDGLISESKVDISQIDLSLLDVIAEVLYLLEDENIVFNWQQFRDTCIKKGIEEQLVR